MAVGSTSRGGVAELWNGQRWLLLPKAPGVGVLNAVSCTSPQACSAVSDGNAVQRWNGHEWAKESVPAHTCDASAATCSNILSAIACVSPSACYLAGAFDFASDGDSGLATDAPVAESWDGSRWRAERVPDAAVPSSVTPVYGSYLNGISCTARSVCVTVGTVSTAVGVGRPLVERGTFGAWSVQPAPSPAGPASSQLNAVSCWSATACTAVGYYSDTSGRSFLLAEQWNGGTWTIEPTPGTGQFGGVSCTSVTACTAVGATDFTTFPAEGIMLAEIWNGTMWTAMQTPTAGALSAVSCTSTTTCVAVGSALAESGNGATWTVQPSASGDVWVGVSCGSAEACLAAGEDPSGGIEVDNWNGTTWTLPPQPPQFVAPNPAYAAVSCSAANACTIVVNNQITGQFQSAIEGLAFRWNGTTWSTQNIQLPAGEDVNTIGGVACPSAVNCTAIGSYSFVQSNGPEQIAPLLEQWDGTSWSTEPPPSPDQSEGATLNAVSCASTTTCIAVGTRGIGIPTGKIGTVLEYAVPYVVSYS